jgi:thiamine biosynthesis lipoprotein
MGTTFAVSVDEDLASDEHERVRIAIEQQLDRVNRLMSTYDPGSEVSRFNRHESTERFPVSVEVLALLAEAREVSERSGGAFDVTVAPIVDAWGFGATDRLGPLPDEGRLAALLRLVGYRGLALDSEGGTVSKSEPGIRVDLSGIAQGYAADAVADALVELGLSRFLVDVGGEMRAAGTRRSGRPWRVGIERPDDVGGLWGTVEIRDEGMATSGDYRNWFEEGGARYAHIVDPRTGQPIRMRGASVTVIHESASLADAWATALCVLGPDEGYELARREGLAAVFITRSEGSLSVRLTPAMEGRASEERRDG